MENIQTAILSAADEKPLDFKTAIYSELQDKVYNAVMNRKHELAGSLLNASEEEFEEFEEDEFQSSSEENVDEDL